MGRKRPRDPETPKGGESQKYLMPCLPPPASHLFFFLILFLLPPAHGPATWVPTLFGVPAPEAAQHDSPGGVRVQKQPQGPREHGREKQSAGSGHGDAWGETGGIGVESNGRGGDGQEGTRVGVPEEGWRREIREWGNPGPWCVLGARGLTSAERAGSPGGPALTCSGRARGCARVPGLCSCRSLALYRVPSPAFPRGPPPAPRRAPGPSRPFRFPPPRVRPTAGAKKGRK